MVQDVSEGTQLGLRDAKDACLLIGYMSDCCYFSSLGTNLLSPKKVLISIKWSIIFSDQCIAFELNAQI